MKYVLYAIFQMVLAVIDALGMWVLCLIFKIFPDATFWHFVVISVSFQLMMSTTEAVKEVRRAFEEKPEQPEKEAT